MLSTSETHWDFPVAHMPAIAVKHKDSGYCSEFNCAPICRRNVSAVAAVCDFFFDFFWRNAVQFDENNNRVSVSTLRSQFL